jgi:hypothetical protein
MGWRFYPLEDFPKQGVLMPPRGKPIVAEFISVERAREEAKRKLEGRLI